MKDLDEILEAYKDQSERGLSDYGFKKQLQQLIVRERLDELKRKITLNVELMSSQDYKDGFSDALDQIDKADAIREAELNKLQEGEEVKPDFGLPDDDNLWDSESR